MTNKIMHSGTPLTGGNLMDGARVSGVSAVRKGWESPVFFASTFRRNGVPLGPSNKTPAGARSKPRSGLPRATLPP
ncbi:hypothetical protein SAMN00790413_00479 [Deinococcus hopiensis KR-140]|uniref:Uncharacterized protein n=1 Tax=Deinococcus hopiensis KR-140 TaxID=695939 RepID=A0A1W1V7Y8_9DEIO|nr:hypothetical protein SAMN00790413_00479 [Deinococcus hopiensis KR-140]